MKKVSFELDGETIFGFVEKVGADIWINVNHKTFKFESQSKSRKKSSYSGLSNPNEISAPMPGKITAIKKKNNETLKTGDIVIVMEAMKMEYSLKANKDGIIKAIHVKEGEQVVLGQLLAEIQ